MNSTLLREKRQALLDLMLNAEAAGRPAPRAIPRRDPAKPAPLSFSQERFWFLDQLAVGSQFYVENSAVRLAFEVNPDTLERAINAVVARHEILRTHFEMRDGGPVQAAADSLHVPLAVFDLSETPQPERDREVERLALEHAMRPFGLGEAPLLRTDLIKLGRTEFVFLLAIHHIISDGWSMGIFGREVSECYAALAAGRQPSLQPLPIQYADYAAWQRDGARAEWLDKQLLYWREQLRGAPQVELALDHPRPRALTFRGTHLEVAVPPNLSAGLRAISQREHATLFMTSLALFAAVIGLHSGQTDFPVGTPVAGRNRAELEGLIGLFLNTLVLRVDLSGDPSFRALLRRVKQTALAAYDNQDVPFDRLVEDLQPDRDLGKNPLFQILFQFFTPPNERAGGASARPEAVAVDRGTAILDLSWHLWDTPGGIRGRIEYSTELFEQQTVERHFRHFLALLAEVIAHPDRPLSELNVVTPEERHMLLAEWQGKAERWPEGRTLTSLFEEAAARQPGAVAVIEGERLTTRAELDARANRLARHLKALGVRRGDRVAICLERSADMTAAALAVLKAGAAYVPLDPAYPAARLDYILEDSAAKALISTRAYVGRVSPGGARLVLLDEDAGAVASQSPESPGFTPDPQDAAYVIYTSGSTGVPKGVVGLHGATMNRFEWMWKEFPFRPGEVACQRAALSFVDSVWEMFGPLLGGVPLVVVPEETGRDARATVELLARHGVTRLLTVPSLLTTILETVSGLSEALPKLRLWFSSGERLARDAVRRFREALPDRELVNLYGSSEAAGDIMFERVCPSGEARESIGRPIANSRAYVLSPKLGLLPTCVTGELFVAGPNLARGYHARPAITAERFLPDPFAETHGSRMYATGDRARRLPDGRIEFLGRADHQVKLRGFRVELGEVEAVLRQHPRVRDLVVCLHEDGAGGSLTAYAVAEGEAPSNEELRRFAASRLPAHMTPGAIAWLDSLPLLPNGKLDRDALRKIQVTPAGAEPVAPRTDAEHALAAIWSELLGAEQVGVFDNFFDLGGHSLLAVRLVSRLRDEFGVELPLREVFLQPTVSQLAVVVESRLLDEIEQLSDEEARRRL